MPLISPAPGARAGAPSGITRSSSRPLALVPLHDLEIAHMAELPRALERLDLPDSLTIQAWYLEQGGVGNLWQHVEAVGLAAYHLAVMIRAHGYPVDPLLAHRGGLLHDIAKISAKNSPIRPWRTGRAGA